MLKRLSALPIDSFLLALAATVALAALVPAHGEAADAVSAVVTAVLLAVVLGVTTATGRLARLDRGDAIVLLFCGSKKSLASGLPMALVLFPAATVGLTMSPLMIFHQIQLVVCAVIASRLARDAEAAAPAGEGP
ncbi:hypothetical protein A5655_24815 [Mycobacterium sp. 1081908.1]|nr:hypothetical protein A5655_24815 [Mycobacterium sp. 1081908.1]